jgi:hypothetical protein
MSNTAPLREQIQNLTSSTLNGGINNSVTTVTVTTGSVFPATGNYRVRVGDEIMLVTARSSNDLTIVRGSEGSTAASHSSGDAITLVLTTGGFDRFMRDRNPFWGSARPPFGLFDTDGVTRLSSGSFSWVNQGGASVSFQNDTACIDAPAASGENYRIQYRAAPSPTYSVIASFQHMGIIESGSYQTFGLIWRQSTTGKAIAFGMSSHNGSDPYQIAGFKLTDATTFNADWFTKQKSQIHLPQLWLKITDDNTNLTAYVGDALNWIQVKQEARGTYLATSGGVTGPDQVGWYANNHASSLFHQLCKLCHWSYL